MTFDVIPYTAEMETQWDEWCVGAVNSTFQHTRRFLSYHGQKFEDLSVLLAESGETVGAFPAALDPSDKSRVVSHPGATFGGVVHQGWLTGTRMVEAVGALRQYYASKNYRKLIYKLVPVIYTRTSAQDDSYALFRHQAARTVCNLSSAIDLTRPFSPSERRRRGLKKAVKSVTLSGDTALLEPLWGVIRENLARKYDAKPVHSAEELQLIHERFPGEVQVRCALVEGEVEAGVVFFNSPTAWHSQYIAATEKGYDVSALDAVFDGAITEAKNSGARYFDFGTSNEDGGRGLNEGLYRFKSEFGGGGVAHEFYELDL
jgi:hypothetical protein